MSPELMKLMAAGGAGKKAAPPVGATPSGSQTPGGPVGAPMTTPQPNQGQQQAANVDIALAMDLLEKALPPYGSESPQGKALLTCLSGLSKTFGEQREKAKPLIPAELKQLMAATPMGGGATPEMKSMAGGAPKPPGAGAPPPGAGAPPPPMAMAA